MQLCTWKITLRELEAGHCLKDSFAKLAYSESGKSLTQFNGIITSFKWFYRCVNLLCELFAWNSERYWEKHSFSVTNCTLILWKNRYSRMRTKFMLLKLSTDLALKIVSKESSASRLWILPTRAPYLMTKMILSLWAQHPPLIPLIADTKYSILLAIFLNQTRPQGFRRHQLFVNHQRMQSRRPSRLATSTPKEQ